MGDNDNADRARRTRRDKKVTVVDMEVRLRVESNLALRYDGEASLVWDRMNELKAKAEALARKGHDASERAAGLRGLLELAREAGAVAYIGRTVDGYCHFVVEWVMPDGSRKSAHTPDTCPVHGTKLVDDCPHFILESGRGPRSDEDGAA